MLSVVIPAFRSKYLGEALDSLRAQTYKDFEVVVADDASPENLEEVFHAHRDGLNAIYKRFNENKGSVSLTAHWERAIDLAQGEWILLLGDDDLLHRETLDAFHSALARTAGRFDVYRFNTEVVDGLSNITTINPPHPEEETALDFLLARLRWERRSYTCEYIFSRRRFYEIGGFVEFPLAWCSDDATWISMAKRNGIYTVQEGRSYWRKSGENISSARPELAAAKLEATTRFLCWITNKVLDSNVEGVVAKQRSAILSAGPDWFFHHVWYTEVALGLSTNLDLARKLARCTRMSFLRAFLRLMRHDLRVALK